MRRPVIPASLRAASFWLHSRPALPPVAIAAVAARATASVSSAAASSAAASAAAAASRVALVAQPAARRAVHRSAVSAAYRTTRPVAKARKRASKTRSKSPASSKSDSQSNASGSSGNKPNNEKEDKSTLGIIKQYYPWVNDLHTKGSRFEQFLYMLDLAKTNNKNIWVTPYAVSLGVFAWFLDGAYKNRERCASNIDQLRVKADAVFQRYDQCIKKASWLQAPIPRAELYLDIKSGIAQKQRTARKLSLILVDLEQLKSWSDGLGVGLFLRTSGLKVETSRLKQRLSRNILALKVRLSVNNALLYHQQRRRGLAFKEATSAMSFMGELLKNHYKKPEEEFEQRMRKLAGIIFNVRGLLYRSNDDYVSAIVDYTTAIRLCEDEPALYHNRAFLLEDDRLYHLAFLDMVEANKRAPHNSIYVMGIARVVHKLAMEGTFKEQIASYKFEDYQRFEKECGDKDVRVCLKKVLMENARTRFDRAVVLDPENAIAFWNRAEFLIECGPAHYDEAIGDLVKSKSLRPNHESVPFYLGYLYAVKREYSKAEKEFQSAKENMSDYPAAAEFLEYVIEQCHAENKEVFNIEEAVKSKHKTVADFNKVKTGVIPLSVAFSSEKDIPQEYRGRRSKLIQAFLHFDQIPWPQSDAGTAKLYDPGSEAFALYSDPEMFHPETSKVLDLSRVMVLDPGTAKVLDKLDCIPQKEQEARARSAAVREMQAHETRIVLSSF